MTDQTAPLQTKHVSSLLTGQTLLNPDLVLPATSQAVIRMLPWLSVVKIGGHSIMDRGKEAILPVVEELRQIMKKRKLLIATGPGIRARHVMGVGLDLGLPTGVLAALASSEAEQNGHLIAALLAEQGVAYLPHAAVGHHLPFFLSASPAAVSNGYPPYELFEFPSRVGKIPEHRTDTGAFLIADAYGAENLVYVKDVDGVYNVDPHAPEARKPKLIKSITAGELIDKNLSTLPIDRMVLELMASAKHVRQFQIVNGLKEGNLTRALNGKHVGTLITRK